MIDLISDEHVREIIELRKQKFKVSSNFFVFTSLNYIFQFWSDGDICIRNLDGYQEYRPEIAKLYGVGYDSPNAYIGGSKAREHLYELFINDPECMFVKNWNELKQELSNRGLR